MWSSATSSEGSLVMRRKYAEQKAHQQQQKPNYAYMTMNQSYLGCW